MYNLLDVYLIFGKLSYLRLQIVAHAPKFANNPNKQITAPEQLALKSKEPCLDVTVLLLIVILRV